MTDETPVTDAPAQAAAADKPPENAAISGAAGLPQGDLEQLTDGIIAALKTVYDPEIPADIYELGLIYKVDIADPAGTVSSSPLPAQPPAPASPPQATPPTPGSDVAGQPVSAPQAPTGSDSGSRLPAAASRREPSLSTRPEAAPASNSGQQPAAANADIRTVFRVKYVADGAV